MPEKPSFFGPQKAGKRQQLAGGVDELSIQLLAQMLYEARQRITEILVLASAEIELLHIDRSPKTRRCRTAQLEPGILPTRGPAAGAQSGYKKRRV